MDKPDKLLLHTPSLTERNYATLKALFPHALTETLDENGLLVRAIDADVLQQEINTHVVSGKEERYQLSWPDKKKAILLANTPICATLRPCREESVDFDNTENLYIEGDNLDVLKLLREAYWGRVKMVYIDPPYNTGHDFIYSDKWKVAKDKWQKKSGEHDEDGNRMLQNPSNNGRFHTDWLNMLYPRLKIARELLTEDGVIFISIDDNEVENLKKICNEIFGEENLVDVFYIQVRFANKSLNEKDDFQKLIEQVLVYAKNKWQFKPQKPFEEYNINKFCHEIIELEEGKKLRLGSKEVTLFKPGQYKILRHPEGRVGWLKDTWASGSVLKGNTSGKFFDRFLSPRKEMDGLGCLYKVAGIGEDGLGYRYFRGPKKESASKGQFYSGIPLDRLEELKSGHARKYKPIVNFYDLSGDFGNIRHEGGVDFRSGKKPTKMIREFLHISNTDSHAVVLDFFSGSATTAHAVMQLNAEDGGKRKFIMVQLPERCAQGSEAATAGYKNICEMGKERIRRAGEKIKADNAHKPGIEALDTGFRVLKLDSSNMKELYYRPEDMVDEGGTLHMDLDGLVDTLKEGRSPEDLLFQVMLDLGILLSNPIEQRKTNGKTIFSVADNHLMACFEPLSDEMLTEIAQSKPHYAIFRDSSFSGDFALVNLEQIFRTYSPSTHLKLL
ncbi:MAG: site-specific DNA-methyltransferase [Cystobacterineae bacterium]|nr:site-specific DNA-methyltransferase [Cystobacterineae bacterium]